MKPTLYVDLDGVFADFWSPAARLHGYTIDVYGHLHSFRDGTDRIWNPGDYEIESIFGLTDAEFWRPIDADPFFWSHLPSYKWASWLRDNLDLHVIAGRLGSWSILTKPGGSPMCWSGKADWCRRVLGLGADRITMTADKTRLAKPGTILIDDHTENCVDFDDAGGHAILFPQHWNAAGIASDPASVVAGELDAMVGALR